MKYKVLLYYKYTLIENPEEVKNLQKSLCESLNITGRILLSSEGLNGTVCGTPEAVDKYILETTNIKTQSNNDISVYGFKDTEFKISECEFNVFSKLKILIRPEIVTLGLKKDFKDVQLKNKADYIEPDELLNLYETNDDFYIIDARNEYEARIGRFKNTIFLDIENFRDFPAAIKKIEHLKDKKVITFCTGGIRCEKASAYLIESGFSNVRQLHGGIHRYSDKTGGKYFDGEMYVFDKRLHIKVNHVNPTIISECFKCRQKISRYINCANNPCSMRLIACEKCEIENSGCCSISCVNAIALRV